MDNKKFLTGKQRTDHLKNLIKMAKDYDKKIMNESIKKKPKKKLNCSYSIEEFDCMDLLK